MDQVKIGAFIAQLRQERGWTQEMLGERIGVTNKTVSRWENGNYMPGIEMLTLLSGEFGVSLNELVQGQRLEDDAFRAAADENLTAVLERPMERLRRWLDQNAGWALTVLLLCTLFLTAVIVYLGYQREHPVDAAPPGTFSYWDDVPFRQVNLSFYQDGKYSLSDSYGYTYHSGSYTKENDLIRLDEGETVRWAVIKGKGLYAPEPLGDDLRFYQWHGNIPFRVQSQPELWLDNDPIPEQHPDWHK